ncbi:hypothetical protein EGW08_005868, partial [Elysia chlorotica]
PRIINLLLGPHSYNINEVRHEKEILPRLFLLVAPLLVIRDAVSERLAPAEEAHQMSAESLTPRVLALHTRRHVRVQQKCAPESREYEINHGVQTVLPDGHGALSLSGRVHGYFKGVVRH